MRNTRYNTFAIVIPRFSDSESDIGNDIPSISNDILGISNRKNRHIRYQEYVTIGFHKLGNQMLLFLLPQSEILRMQYE